MKKQCTKYEGLFIFADDETMQNHLAECEDCREQDAKFERVSELLQEVKPLYKKRTHIKTALKAACMIGVLLMCSVSFNTLDTKYALLDTLKYGEAVSLEDMGFPVDSYGLLMVE